MPETLSRSFRPLSDRILVRPLADEKQTHGGLVIPDSARRQQEMVHAIVVAVGPGDICKGGQRGKMLVKPGDHIVFPHSAGHTITLEGNDYVCFHQEQFCYAVIEP